MAVKLRLGAGRRRHRTAGCNLVRRRHPGDVATGTTGMMRAAAVADWEGGARVGAWLIVRAAVAVRGRRRGRRWPLAARAPRRRHRAALGERGWLLERERESAARTAVDAERARIARELHDIVSHNVSLMVVQAGAAREVLATLPDEAADGAARGRDRGPRHDDRAAAPARACWRRRPDGADEPGDLAPQPSLSRLSPLIDRIAFAGLPVEVRISGEPRPLPAGLDADRLPDRAGGADQRPQARRPAARPR